ncbi:hypothetical protein AVEN_168676-1 [Araneus ventricosus]|uniref:C2H2-type domain-containing protein n=1 Tax=Araneus ventricosus TaxID=182803 RepID=A0A4Y2FQF2_ARAVE|nr:hypothetical protein AVEN_168676-1 [Araneus ventricosus]
MLRLNGTLSMDNSSTQYVEKSSVGKIINFLIHYRHHTVEKIFSSDSCEKRFFAKNHQTRHLQIHREERTFACEEYERRFAKKCQLIIHSWTHTTENPLKFPIYGKAFADNSVLNRDHKAIHNKKKT